MFTSCLLLNNIVFLQAFSLFRNADNEVIVQIDCYRLVSRVERMRVTANF